MKVAKLDDFVRGWFIGNFDPSVLKTDAVEVAHKIYEQGDYEEFHHHKVATEITAIVKGRVEMNGVEYGRGDVIVIEPGEGTDFRALTDAENVVVKVPCVGGDKYCGPCDGAGAVAAPDGA